MRNVFKRCVAFVLTLIMCVGLLPIGLATQALATPHAVEPYYVIVTAKDGVGVNLRAGPGTSYDKLREDPIPMQAILKITKEDTASNGKTWGYTTYENVSGWIGMTEVTKTTTGWTGDLSPKIAEAYAEVLTSIKNQYGICTYKESTMSSDGYQYYAEASDGLAYAELIDFDGNGTPELYLCYSACMSLGYLYEEVWYWNGKTAERVRQSEIYSNGSHVGYSSDGTILYTRNGKTYLASGSAVMHQGQDGFAVDILQFKNGSFSTYQSMRRVIDWYRLPFTYTLNINGKVVMDAVEFESENDIPSQAEDEFLAKYDLSKGNHVIRSGAWISLSWKCNDVDGLIKLLSNQAKSASSSTTTTTLTAEEALAKVPYLGGKKSDMKLTAAQAEAFADVLKGYSDKTTRAILFNANGSVGMFVMYNNGAIRDYRFDGSDETNDYGCSFNIGAPGPDGYDFGFSAYMWDGTAVQPWGLDDNDIYTKGIVTEEWTGSQSHLVSTTVYPFENGKVNKNKGKTYEGDGAYKLDNGINMIDCTIWDGAIGGETSFFGDEPITGPEMEAALRAFVDANTSYTYPKVDVDTDKYVQQVAKAAADALGGEVTAIYKLEEGVYYVIITVNGERKGVMIRGVKVNGEIVWQTEETHDKPADQSTLDGIVAADAAKPNVELDFNAIKGATIDKIKDVLGNKLDNMPGITPNDAAKSEIVSFIETAISSTCAGSVSAGDNRLVISGSDVSDIAAAANKAKVDFDAVLDKRGVELNKKIVIMVRILWENVDSGEPCQVTLDKTLLDALSGCGIQILLGDGNHYIQMTSAQLKALVDMYGTVNVQLACTAEGVYTLNFLKADGTVIDKLETPVTVTLPAASELCTIMVSYSGGSLNWGGQYDRNAMAITFDASYSGQYEIIENSVEINDIDGVDEETKKAIAFLVSKGYMSAENGLFNPDQPLTRYEFTQALVGMFFALDPALTTSFPDVPADSPYYAYVASGEADHIIEGDENGNFSGDNNITNEQMLALAARTLIEHKDYLEPADYETHLASFTDGDAVSEWAQSQVALSIREGIVDRGGELMPLDNVTRGEAALILYRLFLLLHEVPTVALELPPVSEKTGEIEEVPTVDETEEGKDYSLINTILTIIIIAAVLLAIAAIAQFIIRKVRKTGKHIAAEKTPANEPTSEEPFDFTDIKDE